MAVHDAIDVILNACDKRVRKLFFPTKAWISTYIRPIFPDFVDRNLAKTAKL